jgi:hypothetical protein
MKAADIPAIFSFRPAVSAGRRSSLDPMTEPGRCVEKDAGGSRPITPLCCTHRVSPARSPLLAPRAWCWGETTGPTLTSSALPGGRQRLVDPDASARLL